MQYFGFPTVNVDIDEAIETMFANGGLPAQPFATKALMTASILANGSYAQVTDDTVNNGLYVKTAGAWVKSNYDPKSAAVAESNAYANTKITALDEQIGYYKTVNLVNPLQATAAGYYATGNPNGATSHIAALDYYAIGDNTKFWSSVNSGGSMLALYDIDKVYLKTIATSENVSSVYTIPTLINNKKPAFVRVSTSGSSIASVQLGFGKLKPPVALAYNEEYKIIIDNGYKSTLLNDAALPTALLQNKTFISGVLTDATAKKEIGLAIDSKLSYYTTQNLVNLAQATAAGYYSTGVPSGDTTHTAALDYYAIEPSSKFWSNVTSGGTMFAVYDSSKVYIGSISTTSHVGGVYTVPALINNKKPAFLRISHAYTTIRNMQFGIGDTKPPRDLAYNEYYSVVYQSNYTTALASAVTTALDLGSGLKDKKWAAMGDSITATVNCYCDVLASRHTATLTKYAYSGARIHRDDPASPHHVLAEGYALIPNENPPDIITIAGGTNDGSLTDPAQLGVMTDRTVNTFYGALHVMLAGLRSKFPRARIGFLSQIPRDNVRSSYDPANAYRIKQQAVLEVCAYYSVPVWQGMYEFGFHPNDNATTKAELMPDGLHPSEAGHIWFANRVEDFVLSLAK